MRKFFFNPKVLADLIQEAPDRKGLTHKEVARQLAIDRKYLSRQINPDDINAKLGVEDFLYFTAVTDTKALDYMEQALGRVAFEIPKASGESRAKWHELLATASIEGGEANGILARALADDGVVDSREAEAVIAEVDEAVAVLMEIRQRAVKAIQSGKENQ